MTAGTVEDLEAAVERTLAQARQNGMELRRVWCAQDRAFVSGTAFGLGLGRMGGR